MPDWILTHLTTPQLVRTALLTALLLAARWIIISRVRKVALLRAARDECAVFFEEAKLHIEQMVRREGLESLSVEPRVSIRVEEAKKLVMLARVPARRKGRIEQAILRQHLTWREDQKVTGEGSD